jgi:multidrug efflux system membrane fusion protein
MDVPVQLLNFGELRSPADVMIVPQVGGKLAGVHFKEGSTVSKGDLLFSIEEKEYKAEVAKAKAQLAADQADLKQKRETLQRNKKLIGQELISQEEYDEYVNAVAMAEAAVELDKASLELAEINLGYCRITSPIDGVTGKRLVDEGNVVSANSSPLLNVKTIDPLYVDFDLSEKNLLKIRNAMANNTLDVQVSLRQDTNVFHGTLQFLDNSVDDDTGMIALRATMENPDSRLWPGQFVDVRLTLGILSNAVVAPYAAVSIGKSGPYAYVVKSDHTVELHPLQTGVRYNDLVVVKSGIDAGQTLVTMGQMGLYPGAKIQVQDKAASTQAATADKSAAGTTATGAPQKKPTAAAGK